MKGKSKILMVLVALYPLGVFSMGINDIIASLEAIKDYRADARLTVMMPQANNDVVYDLELASESVDGDRLAPCNYLIDWSLDTPSGPSRGFSAYFDGHHYRYRADRLQEYHMEWDSIPFMPRGDIGDGVQQKAQFVNTLPPFIAADLRRMAADPAWTLTVTDGIVGGSKCSRVTAVMKVDGSECMKAEYNFDAATGLPVATEAENNIGALSEQTVSVVYSPASSTDKVPTAWDEGSLIKRYPEQFERFRQCNFRVENLPGTRLPQFSLPTTTGERYSHAASDRFAVPTIIVMIDPATSHNTELIKAVREAVDALPSPADIIWAFSSNNIDVIESVLPSIRPGEHSLMSARSLARDLGVTEMPVIILAGSDAVVADVIPGYNKNIADVVIQKMALLRR